MPLEPEAMTRVTVWNEYHHERTHDAVADHYPDGIHRVIADALDEEYAVQTATLDEPEHGLTPEVIAGTDVLTWWGHAKHDAVDDEVVDRVQQAVLDGMGLIVLHSAHYSKPFTRLMGSGCGLKWREAAETERLWVVDPSHPIAAGIDDYIEVPEAEMYGEHFDIPRPDEVVFTSWFEGGEVFRSGCCFTRGEGRIFYFRPGHETYPVYHQPEIQAVLRNAVSWASPRDRATVVRGNHEPLEAIDTDDTRTVH